MFTNLKKIISLIFFTSVLTFVFADTTNIPGLYRYKLDNGFELFVAENDSAPLAYIEIAVRAGAVTQTPQNAGLFHLYEHMMFKGNEKYANQEAFTNAANEMGRIDENGSTSIDRVNYFFTVPVSQVRRGIEFWSYAIRTPKLDDQELENEKSVVLSEINADFTNPSRIRSAAIFKNLFPKAPWRVDAGGNPAVVKEATSDILREIQKNYYIPSNAALFVGGDVEHEEIFQYVKEIYSDWQNPAESVKFDSSVSKNPLSKDKKLVLVNPGNDDNMINIGFNLRGPDGETDSADIYPADVWSYIVGSPDGVYSNMFIEEKALHIPESDYVAASYSCFRTSGIIGFYAAMLNDNSSSIETETNYGLGSIDTLNTENLSPVEKSELFLATLKKKVIPAMANKEVFFKDRGISFVIQQLEDSRIYELETAKSILSSLSSCWSACGSDYFFSYDNNIANVTEDEVVAFIQKYIQNKNGVLVVTVSPNMWEKYKDSFISHGYEEITAENAFWHKSYNASIELK